MWQDFTFVSFSYSFTLPQILTFLFPQFLLRLLTRAVQGAEYRHTWVAEESHGLELQVGCYCQKGQGLQYCLCWECSRGLKIAKGRLSYLKKSLVGVLKETEETRSFFFFFLNLALLIAVRFLFSWKLRLRCGTTPCSLSI